MTKKYDTYTRVTLKQITSDYGLKILLVFIAAIFPFVVPLFLSASGVEAISLPPYLAKVWSPVLHIQSEDLAAATYWSAYTLVFWMISLFTQFLHHDELRDARRNNPPDDFTEMLEEVSEADKVEGKQRALFVSRWILSVAFFFDASVLVLASEWFLSFTGLILSGVSMMFATQTRVFSALDVARRAISHAAKQRDENKFRTLDR